MPVLIVFTFYGECPGLADLQLLALKNKHTHVYAHARSHTSTQNNEIYNILFKF